MRPAGGLTAPLRVKAGRWRAAAAVLRQGRPLHLELDGPWPADRPPDELGPLVEALTGPPPPGWTRAPAGAPGPDLPLTVVIPTHRPGPPAGLAALLAQRPAVSVLVLSNGPAGPSGLPGAQVLRAPWAGHGAARIAALEHVQTELVAFLSDDAVPLGAGWAAAAVGALRASGADAVVCRQLPWPDADPITRARLRAWTPPGSGWAPQADHVASVYRCAALRRHPLIAAPIAEDAWWSAGLRVWRCGEAPVLHSHPRRARALLRRERAVHEQLVRLGRPPLRPDLAAVLLGAPALLRAAGSGPRALACAVAELVGPWLGARRARRPPR